MPSNKGFMKQVYKATPIVSLLKPEGETNRAVTKEVSFLPVLGLTQDSISGTPPRTSGARTLHTNSSIVILSDLSNILDLKVYLMIGKEAIGSSSEQGETITAVKSPKILIPTRLIH